MRFKTPRIQNEYKNALLVENPKLHTVITMLDQFCKLEFNKDICLTDLYRTDAELSAIYSNVPNPPKTSPHCFWKAVDIRSTDWTPQQQSKMLQFLNAFTYTSGQGKPVSFVHSISGNVQHFHIQVD